MIMRTFDFRKSLISLELHLPVDESRYYGQNLYSGIDKIVDNLALQRTGGTR